MMDRFDSSKSENFETWIYDILEKFTVFPLSFFHKYQSSESYNDYESYRTVHAVSPTWFSDTHKEQWEHYVFSENVNFTPKLQSILIGFTPSIDQF